MNRLAKIFLLFVLLLTGSLVSADPTWQQIDASSPFVDQNGIERTPSCSGGPIPSSPIPVAANTDFSFFYREGDPQKLIIALDGGGACWEANTCIGSALSGNPIYSLEVDETPEALAALGGLGDSGNPNNPFSSYMQVFVPYCTGDIHWGSKDTTYYYTPPGETTPLPWTIHHRGYDNLLAVLRWLQDYYQNNVGDAPDKVVITGLSGGGYGTLLAFPALKEMLPRGTKTYLLADSANGVISMEFYEQALGGYNVTNGAWGIEKNMPDFLWTPFTSGPDSLAYSVYTTLAWRFPLSRIGQITRAWDETQIFYYNVSKHVDHPELWTDPASLIQSALEWTLKARTYMHISALSPNYRFYIAAGREHTFLADDSFYSENSARGIYLSSWTDDMINKRGFLRISRHSDWRNVSCAPSCLE